MSVFYASCVILVILIKGFMCEECAQGWITKGDKCYFFSSSEKSRMGAIQACRDDGALLAAVPNREINDFLVSYRGQKPHWIGLLISDNKWTWYWNDGNSLSTLSTFGWDSKEPSDDATCARIADTGLLRDYQCERMFYYICESDIERDSPWENYRNHWYYFSDVKTSHYAATSYCLNGNAYLARVIEQEEIDFVLSNRENNREYWIGLSRRYWTDGSSYNWHNFHTYTTDGIGKCFILQGSVNQWTVVNCNNECRYICEKAIQTYSSTESAATSATSTISPTTATTTPTPAPTTETTTTRATSTITTTTSTRTTTTPTPAPTTQTSSGQTDQLSYSTMKTSDTSDYEMKRETSSLDYVPTLMSEVDITTMINNVDYNHIHDTKDPANQVLVYVMGVIFFMDAVMGVIVLALGLHLRKLMNSHKHNPISKLNTKENIDSHDFGQSHGHPNDTYDAIVSSNGESVYENVDSGKRNS